MSEQQDASRKRRNPHEERQKRQAIIDDAPLSATSAPARRNPHVERESRRQRAHETQAPVRPRKSPREQRSVRKPRVAQQREFGSEALAVTVVESPATLIGVAPDFPNGECTSHDRDAFAVARQLAGTEGAVVVIVFGPCQVNLNQLGADRVVSYASVEPGYQPEWKTACIATLCEQLSLAHLVIPDSELGAGDIGRRVAARLGVRPATHAWKVDVKATARRSHGGHRDTVLDTPRVVLVADEAAELDHTLNYEARELEAPTVVNAATLIDQGLLEVDPSAIPLGEAAFIVSGGNGVTDWPGLCALAQALGATLGASRVACDEGHVERHRQVGASGTVVRSRTYVAVGISGAQQHLQGIRDCEHVISINQDMDCPMHGRADLAVVGDAQSIIAALLARLAPQPLAGV